MLAFSVIDGKVSGGISVSLCGSKPAVNVGEGKYILLGGDLRKDVVVNVSVVRHKGILYLVPEQKENSHRALVLIVMKKGASPIKDTSYISDELAWEDLRCEKVLITGETEDFEVSLVIMSPMTVIKITEDSSQDEAYYIRWDGQDLTCTTFLLEALYPGDDILIAAQAL